MSASTKNSPQGFTLTEVLIVVTLIGLLLGPILGGMFYFYTGTVNNNQRATLAMEAQTILRTVSSELRVSSGVRASNTINDPNAPPEGWTTSNEDLVLIITTPALDSNNNYISNENGSGLYQNEFIYYAEGNNLYKRTLANPEADGNRLATSCPPELAGSGCPADKLISDSFKDMNFTFYDLNNEATEDLATARSIKLFISMEERSFGRTNTFDSNIRVTLRNSLL